MENSKILRKSEINFKIVVRDLIKNLPFIIMAALTVMFASLAYGIINSKPSYTSTAMIAVTAKSSGNNSKAYTSIDTAIDMAAVYKEVLNGKAVRQRVEADTGLNFNKITLNVTEVESTNLLNLSVTSSSPEYAYKAVDTILVNCHSVTDEMFGNAVIEIVKKPSIPTTPNVNKNIGKYTVLGMFLFAAATAAVSVYESVKRDTVKTKSDAVNNIEGKCIGTVTHEKGASPFKGKPVSLLITSPLISSKYVESCHRAADYIDYKMRKNGDKVLAIGSVYENEGKTSISSNIALTLAEKGKKVMLLDADFRKPAVYKKFDIPASSATLPHYLNGELSLEDAIKYDAKRKIYFCINSRPYSDARDTIGSERFIQLINYAKENMDFVIIDMAPGFIKAETQMLLDAADASALVIRQDVANYISINDEIERRNSSDSNYLGYILNDFDTAKNAVGTSAGAYDLYTNKYYNNYARASKKEER